MVTVEWSLGVRSQITNEDTFMLMRRIFPVIIITDVNPCFYY